MPLRIVSSKECIARMYNDFNIDYSDWENRSPEWIASALSSMEICVSLEPVPVELEVIDFKVKLPCDIKLLDGISYEGERLDRTDTINRKTSDQIKKMYLPEKSYELTHTGYATFAFETGIVTVFYRRVPVEFDTITQLYFPYIPDNDDLKDAICWYILMKILSRGHVNPTYSLSSNNQVTNPFYQYKLARRKAKNSCTLIDKDEREAISKVMRTFLSNPNNYYTKYFDNTYTPNNLIP